MSMLYMAKKAPDTALYNWQKQDPDHIQAAQNHHCHSPNLAGTSEASIESSAQETIDFNDKIEVDDDGMESDELLDGEVDDEMDPSLSAAERRAASKKTKRFR